MSSEVSSDVVQVKVLERRRVAPSSTNLALTMPAQQMGRSVRCSRDTASALTERIFPGLCCALRHSALLKGMLEIAEGLCSAIAF